MLLLLSGGERLMLKRGLTILRDASSVFFSNTDSRYVRNLNGTFDSLNMITAFLNCFCRLLHS